MSARGGNPLVRCPDCESGLLAPTRAEECSLGVVLARRCPECDYRDRVVTTRFAAAVWARHEARIAASLEALADALADGAPIVVGDSFPQ